MGNLTTTVDQSPAVDSAEKQTRPWVTALAATLVVFLVILIARWEIVASPPYFDAAIALWREAEFLARTNFDYYSLRYEFPVGLSKQGSPRAYMTSVMPTILAAAFRLFPASHAPIILYHLAVFLAAAASTVLLFRLLRPRTGAPIAALTSAAFATTPVYCTQIDMVAFEVFLAFTGLVWLAQVNRNCFVSAALVAFVAFMLKPSGAILAMALLAYLAARLVAEYFVDRRPTPRTLAAAAACLAILATEALIVLWGDTLGYQFGERLSLAMAWAWFPDVLILAATAVALGVVVIGRWIIAGSNEGGDTRTSKEAIDVVRQEPAFFCSVAVVILLALAIPNVRFVPRYAALSIPFLYFVLAIAASKAISSRLVIQAALALIVGVNIVNWNGVLFPDPDQALERFVQFPRQVLAREGSLLERSHEYLPNHLDNLRATRIAYEAAQGRPILTSTPFNTYLTFPEFGVVDRRARVYSVFPMGGAISLMGEADDLVRDQPTEIVCLRDASTWFTAHATMEIPSPTTEDDLLFRDRADRGLAVFVVRFREQGGSRWRRWIEEGQSFPAFTTATLWRAYRHDGAAAVYAIARKAAQWEPVEGHMSAVMAAAAARVGAWGNAQVDLLKAEARLGLLKTPPPREADAGFDLFSACFDALVRGRNNEAARLALASSLRDAPPLAGLVDPYFEGLARLESGHPNEAGQYFRSILRTSKSFWPARVALAKVELQDGDRRDAMSLLSQAIADEPAASEPARILALIMAADGGTAQARKTLEVHLLHARSDPAIEKCLAELAAEASLSN